MTRTVMRRPRSSPLGRFGGGWQWKVGIQLTDPWRRRGTLIVSLLVIAVRFDWGRDA